MLFSSKECPAGDDAWRARERRRRLHSAAAQAAVLAVAACVVGLLAFNVSENMAARNIQHGFAFLLNSAGFEIGESPIPFESTDAFIKAFGVGVLNTLKVSLLSIFSALLLGILIAFMKISGQPVLRVVGWAHVEFYRNIPLIVGLFAIYMVMTEVLPDMEEVIEPGAWLLLDKAGLQFATPQNGVLAACLALGLGILAGEATRRLVAAQSTFLVAWVSCISVFAVTATAVWIAVGAVTGWDHPRLEGFIVEGGGALSPEFFTLWLGLTLFSSAPIAEVIRAGVLSVGHGQWLAGRALGLTTVQTASYVVFPQAMRLSVPPLASQFMNLTKNSSLAVVVGYPDVVCIGNTSINSTGQALEMICLIMLVYLLMNLVTSLVMNAVNNFLTKER